MRRVAARHHLDDNVCTVKEMASFTCSCPDAQMMCDMGYDSGMYSALAFVLLAIAVWSQCACNWVATIANLKTKTRGDVFVNEY